MSGAVQPASSIRCLISGTAAAASGRLTVTRTISEPASHSSMHCCAVARGIRRVGHRHRLHDDGRAAADGDVADANGHGAMSVVELDHVLRFVEILPVFLPSVFCLFCLVPGALCLRQASSFQPSPMSVRLTSSARNSAMSIESKFSARSITWSTKKAR